MNNTDRARTPAPPDLKDGAYRRLASAIHSILIKYNGAYEETLADWFLALKLIEPSLEYPRQVVEAFNRLSEEGIIQLHSAEAGAYDGMDASFFIRARFTTALTTPGRVHWQPRSK